MNLKKITADNLVYLHFAIGVRGHSCFDNNIIKVFPVSTTLPPKKWPKQEVTIVLYWGACYY